MKEFVKQYNLLSDLLLATCFTSRDVVQNKLKHLARQLMNTKIAEVLKKSRKRCGTPDRARGADTGSADASADR